MGMVQYYGHNRPCNSRFVALVRVSILTLYSSDTSALSMPTRHSRLGCGSGLAEVKCLQIFLSEHQIFLCALQIFLCHDIDRTNLLTGWTQETSNHGDTSTQVPGEGGLG